MNRATVQLAWQGRGGDRTPVQPVWLEPVGGTSGPVRFIHGDNQAVLASMMGELGGKASLVYLDPPFFTMRDFDRVTRRPNGQSAPIRILTPAFEDRWQSLGSYLDALRERLEVLRGLLAPHGSVVVHVDPRTSHYIRVLGDEIFGPDAFASEIVWRYRRWPSRTPNFQRVHDVLLRWVADPTTPPRFNQLYEDLAPSTVKTWGRGKQRAVFDGEGRRRRSSTEKSESPGVPLGDVWDISIVAPVAKERTGYPTQKPEALLERLIEACTKPGDLVIDPYMGSGTTLSVAAKLGRKALGVDQSHVAVAVTRERMQRDGVEYGEYRAVPIGARDEVRRQAP
ncbi:MAG TPA: site-specific DNA-methyltransferase [Polyangiaceae bacterium]|nr:site-specific DNA-methyltransferase [Polyangiaceae bacterium]